MTMGFKLGLASAAAIAVMAVMGYRMVVTNDDLSMYREQASELKGKISDLEDANKQLVDTNAKLADDLDKLKVQYNKVVDVYNTVVTRTAVTELLVKDNKLTVIVRRIDGSTETIPTTYDPRGEIYVDYVVLDGRLWIRRVFDGKTPPEKGLLVDPSVKQVNWNGTTAPYGKAVYRSLAEGRWIITVTGDGSLGLAPASQHEHAALTASPKVGDFEPIKSDGDGDGG